MSHIFSPDLRVATKEHCKARWSCFPPGEAFRCGFCGHKFKEGDLWRAVYTNSTPGAHGNPLVCEGCNKDDETLRLLWGQRQKEWNEIRASQKFWWFNKGLTYS